MNRNHDIPWNDAQYPPRLRQRLGASAPKMLTAIGNLDSLALPKTALFCSTRCPGDAILRAYDKAANLRDAGRCVISGFHSPVERECLRILLRGKQRIIICPARGLPKRVPSGWKKPLAAGRLLMLSAFTSKANRITAEIAARRNEFVAALADEVFIAHATEGGHLEKLTRRLRLGYSNNHAVSPSADLDFSSATRILENYESPRKTSHSSRQRQAGHASHRH